MRAAKANTVDLITSKSVSGVGELTPGTLDKQPNSEDLHVKTTDLAIPMSNTEQHCIA
jgi:hypothetical protein